MQGDTTTYDYRAITDRLAKRIHLGAVQTGTRTFCGVDLYNRSDKDGFEAVADLTRIDCGACTRMARYRVDVLGEAEKVPAVRKPRGKAEPAKPAAKTGTRARKPAAVKPAAAGSAHEGDGGRQAPAEPAARKRRPSRATRSAELSEAARAKRELTVLDGPDAAGNLLEAVEGEFGALGDAAK